MQQLDLVDFINANPSPAVAFAAPLIRAHLAQRSFWTHRGFRLAIKSAMELHGISQCAVDAELGLVKGTVSRALSGRSSETIFRLADKLGYAASGEDLDAVFKVKPKQKKAA